MAKLVFCAFFILIAACAAKSVQTPRVDEHNIVKCDTEGNPEDWKIVDSETVLADGKFLQIVERTITYPRSGLGKAIITCIRVTDLIGDGTGGFPYIIQNGLGFHDVTINFRSQRSHGFRFLVEIYGKE